MSTARCPTCSTLRPAGASFCPKCGTPFDRHASPGSGSSSVTALVDDRSDIPTGDSAPWRLSLDMSVWTGVKLGAGFVIGAALVTLVAWAIVIALLALGISGLSR